MELLQIAGLVFFILGTSLILMLDSIGDKNVKRIREENRREVLIGAKSDFAIIKSNYEKRFKTPYHVSFDEYLTSKGLN